MKTVIRSFLLLLLFSANILTLKAQSSKKVVINNFKALSVSNGIDLYLSQSNSENIKITAHPDLIKGVIVEKEGNNLKITYKDNVNWGKILKGQSIKVYVNYKTLEIINASGGSDVYTQNTMRTDRLTINSSGGADLKLNVVAKDIQVLTSGGSDVDLKGSAVNMNVNTSGGSDLDAYDFIVEYAKVNVSGGSDANVHVTKGLEANVSGGSDINYKGNASLKKTSSSKSGEVKKVD